MTEAVPASPDIRPMAERFRGYLPVVVDVETGGFDWNRHALLEIAAVPVELDDAGLTRLAEMSVLRSRMDTRLGGGQVVFLHVVLGRMARQAHQVGESGVRVMKTGACPGIDKPDEVRKTARWILEFSFATAPQGPLGRMGPVLKLSGGGLASARRQLQRELAILPEAVWLNGDTKQLVNAELSNANTADLTRLGLLDRTAGMQSGERLARRVEG